ncbi:MAG TPA: S-methyl-5'-thioadenosine phosphorylase [Caulobacteraceae bacterium]
MSEWVLGIIGGTGLYDIEGMQGRRSERLASPWGEASDELTFGEIEGVKLVFLPRHGRGHRITPTHINARANIDVLKRAGCTDVLSLSAVGSLKQELSPGTFVVVDQYIDRTFAREKTFFGHGVAAHVSMAHPVCPRLAGLAAAAARDAGVPVVEGGTYLCMEGPQFSTKAESVLYRSWGCDVIGMTNMPEAKLAREAELPYASVCMVTDYDCWHEEVGPVEISDVLKVLADNAAKAREVVRRLAGKLTCPREPSPIDTGLDFAIVTAPEARDPELVGKLDAVAGRVLNR